jgi:hypothetical protein
MALAMTLLTYRFEWYATGIVGNTCGPNEDEICYGPVLRSGYPFAYVIDNPEASVTGQLADIFLVDDFVIPAFLLDVLVYTVTGDCIYMFLKWFVKRKRL